MSHQILDPRKTGKTVIAYNYVMEQIKNNGDKPINVNIDGEDFVIFPSTTLDEYIEYTQIAKKQYANVWTKIGVVEEEILSGKLYK